MNAIAVDNGLKSDTRPLVEQELAALFKISKILSNSLNLDQTLVQVLKVLDEDIDLTRGLVTISDEEQSAVKVCVVHGSDEWLKNELKTVRYRSGEGVIGRILASGNEIVLGKIASEPNFLHKLDIYEYDLPFIGVPIVASDGSTIGVLAAQPASPSMERLPELSRFMRMIANLIVQHIQLANKVQTSQNSLREERDELRREVRRKYGFDQMVIGQTEAMRRVHDQVKRVGKWDSTVLILGESGTGKELIASSIHYNSPRCNKPFIKLNCAALPENLLESELFGHEKGAFTGAVKMRQGKFEQADNGTLFLDEIGEISQLFQAKLLRVLQENELERVGGNETIKVNVRIVAATNRDLQAEVEDGRFREDLYYRLNVMPIQIPPLRERLLDIPELAQFLVDKIGKQQKRQLKITDGAIRTLMNHNWPGNVRELENCLERAAIMTESGVIDLDVVSISAIDNKISVPPSRTSMPDIDLNDQNLDERERVTAALEQAGWVQARAARLLGMTPRQIAYRIQTLNINMR
ncbi:MAG: nif-specific transcriptional activator NifA, partial [Pseudomonadales bacterium]|nr:nif-specific transcriptional activator NifA [Pseudomonadales bacterium]